MSTAESTRTITPEMRRELLADWDVLTRNRESSSEAYYRLLHYFMQRFARSFGFSPNTPYLTGDGGTR